MGLTGQPRLCPGDVVRSLLFYVIFYGGSIPLVVAAIFAIPAMTRGAQVMGRAWSRWHRACAAGILGIHLKIEGEIPAAGTLIAMKHESFFEAIDLPTLLTEPAVFAKAELMRIPLWGFVGKRYGLIEVDRGAGASALRAMIAAAREFSTQGRPLVIFPEGTRVPHGQAAPLQAGFAGLYKLLGCPVIPVAVNSGPLYHRRWKRRGIITVRFGAPIPAGLPRADAEARVLEAINALNGQ